MDTELIETARAWAAEDPDPRTARELTDLIALVEDRSPRSDGVGPTFRVGGAKPSSPWWSRCEAVHG